MGDEAHRRARPRPLRRFLAEMAAVAMLGASALSGCGTTPVAGPGAQAAVPVVHASLATSVETSAGYWATAAMGNLGQPLNTFWQLFFRPAGTVSWSDRASSLAVATNGGLVVATRAGRSLTVGVRPVSYLDYSPLIVTTDGHSWTPAGPLEALVDEPDALTIAPGGEAMAIVSTGKLERVLTSAGGLTSWREIAAEDVLARTRAGRTCGLVALTSVGYAAGKELIGASCRRAGIVGIFTPRLSAWTLAGPRLPRSLANSGTTVVGLETTTRGLCAIIAVTRMRSTEIVVACTSGNELSWHVSAALSLSRPGDAISFGPAGGPGLYALVPGPGPRSMLAVLAESDMSWRLLPSPPARTAAVVFGPAARVDALAVEGTSFADWLLSGTRGWTKVQQMHVAIQFGSSG